MRKRLIVGLTTVLGVLGVVAWKGVQSLDGIELFGDVLKDIIGEAHIEKLVITDGSGVVYTIRDRVQIDEIMQASFSMELYPSQQAPLVDYTIDVYTAASVVPQRIIVGSDHQLQVNEARFTVHSDNVLLGHLRTQL